MPTKIDETQRAALERLIAIAKRDTGQARRVANFLLAWWNAEECGGFDLTDIWQVDTAIAADFVTVFLLIAGGHSYPDTLGYGADFERIVKLWRPALGSSLQKEEQYHAGEMACIEGAALDASKPGPWQDGWKAQQVVIADLEAGKYADDDEYTGIEWWNGMDEANRRYWMRKAGDTGRTVDAWECFKREGQPCTPVFLSPPKPLR